MNTPSGSVSASGSVSGKVSLECIVPLENGSQTHSQVSPLTCISRCRCRSVCSYPKGTSICWVAVTRIESNTDHRTSGEYWITIIYPSTMIAEGTVKHLSNKFTHAVQNVWSERALLNEILGERPLSLLKPFILKDPFGRNCFSASAASGAEVW